MLKNGNYFPGGDRAWGSGFNRSCKHAFSCVIIENSVLKVRIEIVEWTSRGHKALLKCEVDTRSETHEATKPRTWRKTPGFNGNTSNIILYLTPSSYIVPSRQSSYFVPARQSTVTAICLTESRWYIPRVSTSTRTCSSAHLTSPKLAVRRSRKAFLSARITSTRVAVSSMAHSSRLIQMKMPSEVMCFQHIYATQPQFRGQLYP